MRPQALALVGLVGAAGCATNSRTIVLVAADASRFPISLSQTLLDDHGVVTSERQDVVGRFRFQSPGCLKHAGRAEWWGPTLTYMSQPVDISSAVNDQVQALAGDAVVGLEVTARKGDGCVAFELKGDVVKVRSADGRR
jgi:hypothetical protein